MVATCCAICKSVVPLVDPSPKLQYACSGSSGEAATAWIAHHARDRVMLPTHTSPTEMLAW